MVKSKKKHTHLFLEYETNTKIGSIFFFSNKNTKCIYFDLNCPTNTKSFNTIQSYITNKHTLSIDEAISKKTK